MMDGTVTPARKRGFPWGCIGVAMILIGLFPTVSFGVLWLVFSGEDACDWRRRSLPVDERMGLESGQYDISYEFWGAREWSGRRFSDSIDVQVIRDGGAAVNLRKTWGSTYHRCGRDGRYVWSFQTPAKDEYRIRAKPVTDDPDVHGVTLAISRAKTARQLMIGIVPIVVGGILLFAGIAAVVVADERRKREKQRATQP